MTMYCSSKCRRPQSNRAMRGMFGDASATVVIEEFLSGIECSVFVLTDGKNYKILPEAKDYKRIGEGDILCTVEYQINSISQYNCK